MDDAESAADDENERNRPPNSDDSVVTLAVSIGVLADSPEFSEPDPQNVVAQPSADSGGLGSNEPAQAQPLESGTGRGQGAVSEAESTQGSPQADYIEEHSASTSEVGGTAAEIEDATAEKQELIWTWPAPSEAEIFAEAPYEGRVRVGDLGSIIRIKPSVRTRIAGGHRPDSVVDAGEISSGLFLGAVSVKGASHHHALTPRQDAYSFTIEDDWLVAAVADGVSEGAFSHLAADRAATVAVNETKKCLASGEASQDLPWDHISKVIREAVRALGLQLALGAAVRPRPSSKISEPSDFTISKKLATTCDLLVTRLEPDPDGRYSVTRVRVSGDGSFYAIDPERGWGLLGIGKDAEGAQIDNSVIALPLDPGPPTVTHWSLGPGQAVMVCTDGFGDVIGRGALPVGRYLFGEWQRPLDTTELLRTASFLNMNADDDRTAIILWASR